MLLDIENFWIPLAVVLLLVGFLGVIFWFHRSSARLYTQIYKEDITAVHRMTHVGPKNDNSPEDLEFRRLYWPKYRRMLLDVAMIWAAILVLTWD